MSIIGPLAVFLAAIVGGLVGWHLGTAAVRFPDYRIEPTASIDYAGIEERAMARARRRRMWLTLGLALLFSCLAYAVSRGLAPP